MHLFFHLFVHQILGDPPFTESFCKLLCIDKGMNKCNSGETSVASLGANLNSLSCASLFRSQNAPLNVLASLFSGATS